MGAECNIELIKGKEIFAGLYLGFAALIIALHLCIIRSRQPAGSLFGIIIVECKIQLFYIDEE